MLIGRQKKILSKILVNYAGINSNENYYNRKVLKYKVRAALTSNNYFYITNILKKG
ncbi:MAG: hypothetical protein E6X34_04495 [Clostridium sp.]|uniref:hypothetical protein n=1 Tax=Clostridium sp. TaxID=1506 RepID=UPI002907983A|nr:hypothetical protein [Clostridium sp.]MDU4937703.1 hypothetical protein [Clostridium sp.]